jgi:hypothetical protein
VGGAGNEGPGAGAGKARIDDGEWLRIKSCW